MCVGSCRIIGKINSSAGTIYHQCPSRYCSSLLIDIHGLKSSVLRTLSLFFRLSFRHVLNHGPWMHFIVTPAHLTSQLRFRALWPFLSLALFFFRSHTHSYTHSLLFFHPLTTLSFFLSLSSSLSLFFFRTYSLSFSLILTHPFSHLK